MGKKPGKQRQANSREAIRSNTILTRENQDSSSPFDLTFACSHEIILTNFLERPKLEFRDGIRNDTRVLGKSAETIIPKKKLFSSSGLCTNIRCEC